MKARELLVLIESLIELEGEDAKVMYNNGQDGFDEFVDIHAGLQRIGDQREEQIVLVIV